MSMSQSVARKQEFSKLDELADEWGLTVGEFIERYALDDAVPGICMNPGCPIRLKSSPISGRAGARSAVRLPSGAASSWLVSSKALPPTQRETAARPPPFSRPWPVKETPMSVAERATVLTRASREWWRRPDDERYLTLDHLYASTRARADASEARTVLNTSLVAHGAAEARGELYLEHDDLGVLDPTHWSLGQLATISRTPAKWIRDIAPVPTGPAMAAHAINLGLRHLVDRAKVQVMKFPTSPGLPTGKLRCIVGPDYGRIYDHEVVRAVMDANEDGRWHVPAASYQTKNPKRATTLYASDRDVFIFLVDERNPVSIHVDGTVRQLFRGFMVWNSEVGHHKFGFMTFLYDYVCDNRMVWGAREVKEISIKHTERSRPLRPGGPPHAPRLC